MVLNIRSQNLALELKNMASQLTSEITDDCNIYMVKVPKAIGNATFLGSSTNFGISILIIEGTFKEDFIIEFAFENPNPLLFQYCREGHCFHTFNDGKIHYRIPPLASSITRNSTEKQSIRIAGAIPCTLAILFMDKLKYGEDILSDLDYDRPLFDPLFSRLEEGQPFFYQSYYSIALSECIKQMQNSKYKGLVNKTYLDAKILELLALQLEQYQSDLTSSTKQVLLRKYDLQKIVEAKDILLSNLIEPPTIVELAKKIGINQQKLKKGFKLVFSMTIRQHLTKVRMETAMLLLTEGLSVKEVSKEVGYANQSFFARKFRDKYGVLPRDFRKSLMSRLPNVSNVSREDQLQSPLMIVKN